MQSTDEHDFLGLVAAFSFGLGRVGRGLLLHINSKVQPAGPGDSLRFVHAARLVLDTRYHTSLVVLVTESEVKRLAGLFSGLPLGNGLSIRDGAILWIARPAREIAAANARPGLLGNGGLSALVRGWSRKTPVLHAHLGRGLTKSSERGRMINSRVTPPMLRFQIDEVHWTTKERLQLLLHNTQRAPRNPDTLPRVACFVRRDPSSGRVDTPKWFVKDMSSWPGISVSWFGLPNAAAYTKEGLANGIAYGTDTYVDQIKRLRDNYDAAVGFNSGGLDLASAAGLPVLRLNEYQKHGIGASGRKRWGQKYNSFLAISSNIGLAPQRNIRGTFIQSFKAFLQLLLSPPNPLAASEHHVLDPGVPLTPLLFQQKAALVHRW